MKTNNVISTNREKAIRKSIANYTKIRLVAAILTVVFLAVFAYCGIAIISEGPDGAFHFIEKVPFMIGATVATLGINIFCYAVVKADDFINHLQTRKNRAR